MRASIAGLLLLGAIQAEADAQTTRTYEYDALGRLIKVTPGAGTAVTYNYDIADNRSSVVAGAGSAPPVAVDDVVYVMLDNQGDLYYYGYIYDWFQNDYDPDPGDTLTLHSVSGNAYASLLSGGIRFAGPIGSGHQVVTYTIRDTAGGTDSATINIYFYDP